MNPRDLLQALAELEHQLLKITEAVESGEPLALAQTSNDLRESLMALHGQLSRSGQVIDRPLALRFRQLATRLAIQRSGLMRRTALVEQTLQAMVPGAVDATYATFAGTASPYGSARKQTGAFTTLAA